MYECIASHHIALRVLERCAVFESNDAYADAYWCHEADLMPDKFLKSPDAPLGQRAQEASCLLRKQLHGGKRGPRAVVTFRIERVLDSMRELLIDAGLKSVVDTGLAQNDSLPSLPTSSSSRCALASSRAAAVTLQAGGRSLLASLLARRIRAARAMQGIVRGRAVRADLTAKHAAATVVCCFFSCRPVLAHTRARVRSPPLSTPRRR